MKRTLFLVLAAAAFPAFVRADEIPCSDLQVRVTRQPSYPPIAAAAHISGKIELEVHLDADSKILSIDNVRGPALLQGSAHDYVASWDLSWQQEKKHHACIEKVVVDFKLSEPTKSVSSYSYEIVTEDGVSTTTVSVRPTYYKPNTLY